MGITGLIPFLEKASKKGNISQFSGGTVAVDTYCWLHKGAFSCAEKIALGQPTDAYVTYCLKFVNMLLANKIKPILVFDGCHLPAKAETEDKRRSSRADNKRRAAELIKMGRTAEGRTLLRRSVDITHEMALQLMKKCHEMNVDCIVAPYEADAQLAYLNLSGIADVVITEDSDLTLFGCKKIFFKMDVYGNGLLVEQDRIHIAMKIREDLFDIDKFRHMCILSGCDYLPSLPGIGLSKACKFILKNTDPDIHRALCRIGSHLNMKSLVVTEDYRDAFIRALITFKHQLVFCPLQRKQVRLNSPPPDVTPEQLHHAGDEKPQDIAWQLALGNYDPISLRKMHNFDPDVFLTNIGKRKPAWDIQYVADHVSIWSKEFRIQKNVKTPHKEQPEKHIWPNTAGKTVILNTEVLKEKSIALKRSYEDMEDELSDKDIVKLYGNDAIHQNKKPTAKEDSTQKESKEENLMKTPSPMSKNKSNPFLKKQETSPCLIRGQIRRRPRTFIAMEPTVVDDQNIIKSKYFDPDSSQTDTNQPVGIVPETQDEDLPFTPPDEYKENNITDIPKKSKEQIFCRSDSGVELKDDGNDEKLNNSNETEEIIEATPLNNCQKPSIQDNEIVESDLLINHECVINENKRTIERTPSSDDIADFSVNNSSLSSVKSSFFKWTNPKLVSNKDSPVAIRNSKRLQNQNKSMTGRQSKNSKSIPAHNLLSAYGFEKKNVSKH
ncbi:exonuclease 1 [Chelonus insularis]|uniref:exonuclease 1 n=1 Tax=Chelonus insularis TaxID=460826 RepID=UPI00158CBA7B|nr:exonuclease 1 [Chelonus insularis]